MKSCDANAFQSLTTSKELSARLLELREDIRQAWSPSIGGRTWGREHSDLMDITVKRLFELACERSGDIPNNITVIATGGYGQRCLAPWSDVDLTFLVDRTDDPTILREAFQLVMDVLLSGCRIKVGYAYRSMDEILAGGLDHQTQTALLDSRFICGDRALYDRFDSIYLSTLQMADFLFQKSTERRTVRQRNGDSAYLLEPDVKEGAGGLRDVQSAQWIAMVRFGKSGDALYRELVRRKVVTADEADALRVGREFLIRTRNALHLVAGERRDRLVTARQESTAESLGYTGDNDTPAVQTFMHEYYGHSARILDLSNKVISRCLEGPLPLSAAGVAVLRNSITVTELATLDAAREWVPAAIDASQRLGLDLSASCVERIQQSSANVGAPVISKILLSVLGRTSGITDAIKTMIRTGLLERVLPEFTDAMRVIAYDPAHISTVGEHSLNVVANLESLMSPAQLDDSLEAYRYTFATVASTSTLYLAALLHDLGKQWRLDNTGKPAPHEITGAERVPELCARLGCPADVTTRVQCLVRYHLLLADTARLRDLSRSETIKSVHEALGDSDMLRMLYVLTWADVNAVGPGVWTRSAGRLLDELVQRCENEFSHQSADDLSEPDARKMDQVRDRIRRRLIKPDDGTALDVDRVQKHIDAMPTSYLLNTPLDEIRLHVEMAHTLLIGETDFPVVVDVRGNATERESVVTIVAFDDPRPGLLAKITGVLYAYDIKLHSAQVFTRSTADSNAIVIDTLRVDYRERGIDRSLRNDLVVAIEKALSGKETVGDMIARKRRPAAVLGRTQSLTLVPLDTEMLLVDVRLANDSSAVHALCRNLTAAGWNISAARLTQWAYGVRCALYVSDARKRSADKGMDSLRSLLSS
jgi:[protein-PII] uridylyltransferase